MTAMTAVTGATMGMTMEQVGQNQKIQNQKIRNQKIRNPQGKNKQRKRRFRNLSVDSVDQRGATRTRRLGRK